LGWEFEEIGSAYEVESCKILFLGDTSYSLFRYFCRSLCRLPGHNVRHRQTDDSIMPIADHNAWHCDRLKTTQLGSTSKDHWWQTVHSLIGW